MYQYVFIHVDKLEQVWKHIHFSRLAAERARRWWSRAATTEICSDRIREQKRTVDKPQMVGLTTNSVIELENP